MALQTFLREYMQMPIVTRMYTTACVITTVAVVRILAMQVLLACPRSNPCHCSTWKW